MSVCAWTLLRKSRICMVVTFDIQSSCLLQAGGTEHLFYGVAALVSGRDALALILGRLLG